MEDSQKVFPAMSRAVIFSKMVSTTESLAN